MREDYKKGGLFVCLVGCVRVRGGERVWGTC